MLWAIVDNEKVDPTPKTYGACPFCGGKVLSKCGEVKVWHWAHFKDENCDTWYEPESYWHLHWKMTFGKDNAEIVIKKDGKWHVADIFTESEIVIEMQNSPIQKEVIRKRENFYGKRMIWLINGAHFKDNFIFWESEDDNNNLYCNWKYARRSWEDVQRPIFIDFGDETLFWVKDGMGRSWVKGQYVLKETFIEKYGGDFAYYCEQMA